MRKKIMLGAILLTAAIGASASVGFISWCGEQTIAPSQEYFTSPQEMAEFYWELSEDLCGESGPYIIVP